MSDAVRDLAEALRLTREYVGPEVLPALPGWSWHDALAEHAPDVLAEATRGERSPADEAWKSCACQRPDGGPWAGVPHSCAAEQAARARGEVPEPPAVEWIDGEQWECGPHANAWGGHDARCRRIDDLRDEAVESVRKTYDLTPPSGVEALAHLRDAQPKPGSDALPWSKPFWRRCVARMEPRERGGYWGRCELAPHSPEHDHALERGMEIVRWSTASRSEASW